MSCFGLTGCISWRLPVIAALLTLHVGQLAYGAWTHSVTIDEYAHIPSGLSHWLTGCFTPYRVNPPLARMVSTLPLLLAWPATDWAEMAFHEGPALRPEWPMGEAFAASNRLRYRDLVFLARLPGIGWSLFGAFIAYRWAKRAFGETAALAVLVLWTFEPNLLAHAQLVTPDFPAAVLALYAADRMAKLYDQPCVENSYWLGLGLGLAFLAKFTLVLLLPAYLVAAMVWTATRRSLRLAGWFLLSVLIAGLLVGAGYQFEGWGRRLDTFSFTSRSLGGQSPWAEAWPRGVGGNRFAGSWVGALPVPLPADYLLGIDQQRRDFELIGKTRPSYLCGEWRETGWWHYYALGLLIKLPLGLIFLLVLALFCIGWDAFKGIPDRLQMSSRLALLLPPTLILVVASSQTGFNHHVRYVLPVVPFVIVVAGEAFRPRRGMAIRACAWGAALWLAASSCLVSPHHLSYFNESIGGPSQGHRYLIDSNLDWGQDFLALKDWLDENRPAPPIHIAAFHLWNVGNLGITYELPPPFVSGDATSGPTAGFHAVSVSFVMGTAFWAYDGQGRLRFIPQGGYAYFQRFQPIGRIGHSIWLFSISIEEADAVRRELGLPPLAGGVKSTRGPGHPAASAPSAQQ